MTEKIKEFERIESELERLGNEASGLWYDMSDEEHASLNKRGYMLDDRGDGNAPFGCGTRAADVTVASGDYGNAIGVAFVCVVDGKRHRHAIPMSRGVAKKLHAELGLVLK